MIQLSDTIRYAMLAYDNPYCPTIESFRNDYRKFHQLKRALNKDMTDAKQIHLVLNHIMTLYNVFTCIECTKMMFQIVPKEHWSYLKTFCIFLNTMPERIQELSFVSSDYAVDQHITKVLRELS